MSVTVTLPDEIESHLRREAKIQRRSVEELALDILRNAFYTPDTVLDPEEVVAKIQSTLPNPRNIRPATGSLAEALLNAPEDPDFDLEIWNQGWAAVEQELRVMSRAESISDKRA